MQKAAGVDVFHRRRVPSRFVLGRPDRRGRRLHCSRPFHRWRAPGGKVETVKSGKVVDARLRQRRRLAGHESAFLKSHCARPFKITLPTPAQFMFASYQKGVTDQFYPRRTDLTADLVAILQDEIKALIKDAAYIQMDAPSFTDFVDERYRARMRESGLDPEAALDEALAASNDCFVGAKIRELRRRFICVAAINVAAGSRKAATMLSRKRFLEFSTLTDSFWSMIARGREGSSRCDSFLRGKQSCWAWSLPRPLT